MRIVPAVRLLLHPAVVVLMTAVQEGHGVLMVNTAYRVNKAAIAVA